MKYSQSELDLAFRGMYEDGEIEVAIRADGEVLFHRTDMPMSPKGAALRWYRHPEAIPVPWLQD